MIKQLLSLTFLGLLGCQPEEKLFTDVAGRASGRYVVQSYLVNGDTLYSATGINKLGVNDLYIIVDRKTPDSVRVGGFAGSGGLGGFLRDVGISETNGTFQLSNGASPPVIYESTINGNTFYERSVNGGWFLGTLEDLNKTPPTPALEGIIITAQKQ